ELFLGGCEKSGDRFVAADIAWLQPRVRPKAVLFHRLADAPHAFFGVVHRKKYVAAGRPLLRSRAGDVRRDRPVIGDVEYQSFFSVEQSHSILLRSHSLFADSATEKSAGRLPRSL